MISSGFKEQPFTTIAIMLPFGRVAFEWAQVIYGSIVALAVLAYITRQ